MAARIPSLCDEGFTMVQGTVKRGGPTYWFVELDGAAPRARNVFVHYSSIVGDGFRSLAENDRVELEVEQTARGPQGRNVRRIREDGTPASSFGDR